MDLTILCAECKNYFLKNGRDDLHSGEFIIDAGSITPLDFIKPGQYFRISGSVSNDRVISNTADDLALLTPETFTGAIWAMYVPPDFVQLAKDVYNWNDRYSEAVNSPYQSESFKGYSYSKRSGGADGINWQSNFRNRINMYRKVNYPL